MRHRTDANQKDIIAALEKIGCSVYIVGRPVDLLVGRGAINYLLECKSRTGKRTPAQKQFFADWNGQVRIISELMVLNLRMRTACLGLGTIFPPIIRLPVAAKSHAAGFCPIRFGHRRLLSRTTAVHAQRDNDKVFLAHAITSNFSGVQMSFMSSHDPGSNGS